MYFIVFVSVILLNILYYINIKKISKFISIFDYPDKRRKIHKKKIPPIGGICIFLSILFLSLFPLINFDKKIFLDFFYVENKIDLRSIFAFYFCNIILIFVGILDDKHDVSANIRLIIFSLIYYFAIMLDNQLLLTTIEIKTLNITIDLENLGIFFTILCFVVLINALNMFDGINLQTGLFFLIIFIILFIKNIFIFFSLIMIISLVIFLYFNYKNLVFLGNHGIYFISFIITFFITKNYNTYNYITAEEVYLILYLPLLELLRLFFHRVLNNKNPFDGDRNHIHHLMNEKINSPIKTSIITNAIAFTPYVIFTFYENFNILIFSIIFYLIIISMLKFSSRI